MAVDPLSPIAPARIRALLLPVGRIKRSRFLAFVELLQPQCMVRLGDISPDPRPDRSTLSQFRSPRLYQIADHGLHVDMFSPLACPGGTLLYDLSTSLPPPSHLSLSPFELFREPLLIIGIADATEYPWLNESRAEEPTEESSKKSPPGADKDAQEIQSSLESLREQFPKAYLHTLMIFDYPADERHAQLPTETIIVPPAAQQKTTTMKTKVCDITSMLLAEMTTLARSIQALPTVPSPASQANDPKNGSATWSASDNLGAPMGRRNSQVPVPTRPESPSTANQRELHRMSMPVFPSTTPGPFAADDSRASSPTNSGTHTPPTTFDEIPAANNASTLNRTSSNVTKSAAANARDHSSDRVSTQGFGSGGVGERARNKGRGRVGVVIGTLYLCAGQWHEALKELTEGATRARAYSDHLWHAKSLENILVALLLFAWSGMDFQVCLSRKSKSEKRTRSAQNPLNFSRYPKSAFPAQTSHRPNLRNIRLLVVSPM